MNIISLNPPLFVLPIAAFQIAIALLMLGKGQMVKIGLVGAIFFLLATTPLGVWTVPNALMAMSLVLLLRRKFEISFFREPARQVPEELINPVDSIDGVLCGGWTQAHARLGYAVDGHVA